MGNALHGGMVADAAGLRASLQSRADHPSEVVREHVAWALGAAS
jgi:epoxyqueuosine reductase